MKGVSVIICCYNSANRLPETLQYLARQQVAQDTLWELLIINNNSTDGTADIALLEWAKYQLSIPFQILDEPKAGLNYAREKGISSAQYEYLIFCDDDNWLFSNYVQKAYEVMESNNAIGVLGGHGIAKPEIEPEPWIDLGAFATGKQSDLSGDITYTKTTVYGAGSVFRKQALLYLKNNGFKPFLSDRKGDVLTSGGDAELCWAISLAGYKIWYEEGLKFYHFISENRLKFDYLKRMEYGNGFSAALHVPYWEFLTHSKRLPIKNTWWWRYLALSYSRIKRALKNKARDNSPSGVLMQLRAQGCIDGLWALRREYADLQKTLETAKWIKRDIR